MHPLENGKFTDGELHNAMGSDFYRRDRGLKLHKSETNTKSTDDIDDGEEDY